MTAAVKLNLGSGGRPMAGWINLDLTERPETNIIADLTAPYGLPFADDSVDELALFHVIEHIPDTLALMQEISRIAKPDAQLQIRVPYGLSNTAWEDPTHVRPYFPNSFNYFQQPAYKTNDYGYRGDWKVEETVLRIPQRKLDGMTRSEMIEAVDTQWNFVKEMVVILRNVKPIRSRLHGTMTKAPVRIIPIP